MVKHFYLFFSIFAVSGAIFNVSETRFWASQGLKIGFGHISAARRPFEPLVSGQR